MINPWYSSCRFVSVLSIYDSICGTAFPEHFPQIAHQRFRFLVSSKVPTTLVFRLEDNITNRPRPSMKLEGHRTNQLRTLIRPREEQESWRSWDLHVFLRKIWNSHRNECRWTIQEVFVESRFILDPNRCSGSHPWESIDQHPLKNCRSKYNNS